MRRLKIKRMDLEEAFEAGFSEMHHYLDTETGEVLMVSDDTCRELENLMEEAGPEAKLEDVLRESGLSDLEQQALADAQRVEDIYGTSLVQVPEQDARESFHDMAAFVTTVPEPRLRAELQRVIHGRGAFRRFKDVLAGDFRERERWFQFKGERLACAHDRLACLARHRARMGTAAAPAAHAAPTAGAHPTPHRRAALCAIRLASRRRETHRLDRVARHAATLA